MAARTPFARALRHRLFYPLQAVLAFVLFGLIRVMPLGVASGLGGWLGRSLAPCLKLSEQARKNLEKAFPEKSPAEIKAIIHDMWDNLGRTLFEFPHLDRLKFYQADSPVEVVGAEHIEKLRDDGRPGLFFAGHLGNWEVAALGVIHRDLPIHLIYRAPNNPLVEKLYHHRQPGEGELLPKGAEGARRAIKLLKGGAHLGILADQKMNDGIPVPFFGRDAMTAPALAQFALKYDCPVVPVQVERLGGATFRITFYPPEEYKPTNDRTQDVVRIMTSVNARLEKWIRQNPAQWLWLHNRWPD
jgi:Kdo2-lipid IVA lauroyltransferase/acyltransferase